MNPTLATQDRAPSALARTIPSLRVVGVLSALCASLAGCGIGALDGLTGGDRDAGGNVEPGGGGSGGVDSGNADSSLSDTGPGDVCSGESCIGSCWNLVQDGQETDVDCGGTCQPCPITKRCLVANDCTTRSCVQGVCIPSSKCLDTLNGCGGVECAACPAGGLCAKAGDCQSLICQDGKCIKESCADTVKNGSETDVDCGGTCSTKCAADKACLVASDCASNLCRDLKCSAATCSDGVKNDRETGIDCGALACKLCPTGQGCDGEADCANHICTNHLCVERTCEDKVRNGNESDIDCGGSCPDCADGRSCLQATDCVSGVCGYSTSTSQCEAGTCDASACEGGSCDASLGDSSSCDGAACEGGTSDGATCEGGSCDAATEGGSPGSLVCIAPTCYDRVRNGQETGVDCGGSCVSVARCPNLQPCGTNNDCVSGYCLQSTCHAPAGMALQLDGVDDYFELDNLLGSDFTIEFWLKTTDGAPSATKWSDGKGLFFALDQDVCRNGYTGVMVKQTLSLSLHPNQGTNCPVSTIYSPAPPSAPYLFSGNWVQAAVTRDKTAGSMKIILNGILVEQNVNTIPDTDFASVPTMRWFSNPDTPSYTAGTVDELRIWNAVRTPAVIYSTMGKRLLGTESGLVGYYNFDTQPTPGQAADISPRHNHATFGGNEASQWPVRVVSDAPITGL